MIDAIEGFLQVKENNSDIIFCLKLIFNILLIELNEACSVEEEVLKPNCSAAKILLVSK